MSSSLIPLVRSLSFTQDRTAVLARFSEQDWDRLLPLCDRTQLTLPVAVRAIHRVPPAARRRLEKNLADNAERHRRALLAYEEIAAKFRERGVEWIVLKGFSQQPGYCANLDHRPQYDLDFYCPPDSMHAALEAVKALGYEPFRQMDSATDHLPPLIRKTGWRPGAGYFDPTMPFTVELHHRFWDRNTECFHAVANEELWARRVAESYRGIEFPALSSHDRLAYATWHLARHLLRGDLRPYHVYEIAYFLHSTAADEAWWRAWAQSGREDSSRCIAGIAFRLARDWFSCSLHPEAERELNRTPDRVHRWLNTFGFSPLTTWERPNKDELFLHLELVSGARQRAAVIRRRLLPTRFQAPVLDAHQPRPDARLRWHRRVFAAWFIAKRAAHHLRAVWPVIRSGARWVRAMSRPPRGESPHKLRAENAPR